MSSHDGCRILSFLTDDGEYYDHLKPHVVLVTEEQSQSLEVLNHSYMMHGAQSDCDCDCACQHLQDIEQ